MTFSPVVPVVGLARSDPGDSRSDLIDEFGAKREYEPVRSIDFIYLPDQFS